MAHPDYPASSDPDPDPAPPHLIQSFASTLSADPDTDPLRTTEGATAWLRTAGLLPAESRLTKALADGRLVLTVAAASTVRLASAARASYPNLVAAIAVAIAESAASGTWPRLGHGL